MLLTLYIYIYVCVCLYLELGIGSNLSSTPLGPGSQSEMVKACLPPVPEFEPLQPGEGHDSTQCGAAEWHQQTVTHPGTRQDSQPYDDPLQSFAPEAWFQLKGVCYFKQTPEQKAFATRPSIA